MKNMRTKISLTLIVLSCLCVANLAVAQVAALNDAIIKRMIPLLQKNAAQANQSKQAIGENTTRSEAYFKLLEDIGAGRMDALTWLKSKSKHVVVPASARYEQQFSRWLSSKRLLDPVALYTFGLKAPDEILKIAQGKEGADTWLRSGRDPLDSPDGKKVKALNDQVAKFYTTRKFAGPQTDLFYESTYTSPDQSLVIMFTMCNSFAGAGGGDIGSGPILVVKLNPLTNKELNEGSSPDQMGAALEQAGMSQEQYDEYLAAIAMARKDAADPSVLEAKKDEASKDGPPGVLDELKGMVAVRKTNLEVYRRHARQLDPLIAALGL